MLDLRALKRPPRPNHYLIAAKGFAGSSPDELAPEFDLGASALYELARRVVLAAPRTVMREEAPQRLAFEVCQRTPIWRFPDDVTIEIMARGEGRATLVLYSRSRYGYSDFGVNRRRARRWLGRIVASASGDQIRP